MASSGIVEMFVDGDSISKYQGASECEVRSSSYGR
jgi:hypothetical protein